MPIRPFEGRTFVAFIDICGFKLMMKNQEDAARALSQFYQAGYSALHGNNIVQGFFVSDCGILFADNLDPQQQFQGLLAVVRDINRRVLEHDLMLTTSVAYGHFSCTTKLEFEGIDKNPLYGEAYLNAYLDSANGRPKLEPGQCRILHNHIPASLLGDIRNNGLLRAKGSQHLYYYWNVEDPDDIDAFDAYYHDSVNRKYRGMLEALKSSNNHVG